RNTPDAVIAAVTWIFSQYELSAGTSGATFVYSSIPSMPSRITRTSVTNRPSGRSTGRRVTSTSQAVAPTKQTAMMNSYMLPHGTRCAANPRVTMAARCSSQPTAVSTSAPRPANPAMRAFSASPGAASGGAEGATGAGAPGAAVRPPAPTSSRSATRATTDREPNAYSTAYASIARAYPRIAYTSSWSETAAITGPP